MACAGKGGLERQPLGSWGQGPLDGQIGDRQDGADPLTESRLLEAPFGLFCWLPGELEEAA